MRAREDLACSLHDLACSREEARKALASVQEDLASARKDARGGRASSREDRASVREGGEGRLGPRGGAEGKNDGQSDGQRWKVEARRAEEEVPPILNLRTTALQKCGAVSRRARM